MKILLMGDASNYHSTLGRALADMGHEVTVASNGSLWMHTGRDIDISRRAGRLCGMILWAKLGTVLSSRLKGYDVVQIHNPVFLDLRPKRVKAVFDRLKRCNGGVFLTALGTDTPYVQMCLDQHSPLRYSDYSMAQPAGRAAQWLSPPLSDHCRYVYDNIDGAVSALYEYHLACSRVLPAEKLAYGGIPVEVTDTDRLSLASSDTISPLNVMAACHKGREHEKGMDLMLPPLRQAVAQAVGRISMNVVQNVPFAEFSRMLDAAHVVVDQLYSYTPATSALMAMARGKVVVSGGEDDFYNFIGEDALRPIINPDPFHPESLTEEILALATDQARLRRLSQQGVEFVMKHNAAPVVAARFIDFWENRL